MDEPQCEPQVRISPRASRIACLDVCWVHSYCQTQEDVDKLVRGARLCLKIAQTEPLASHLDWTNKQPDLDHELHLKTDAEMEAVVRERVETVYHPTSSCRMAPLEDGGVVDQKLRVYGIPNLRVCDASIFPSIVSGHTVSEYVRCHLICPELMGFGYHRPGRVLLLRRN
jgi:choline dehydrogenase-like flavoprotein